jgi:hypothetical protein
MRASPESTTRSVVSWSGRYGFAASSKVAGVTPLVLSYVGPDRAGTAEQYMISVERLLHAGFSWESTPIAKLSERGFRLLAASVVDLAGRKLTRFDFTKTRTLNDQLGERQIEDTLKLFADPQNGWAIRRGEMHYRNVKSNKSGMSIWWEVEYSSFDGPAPRIKRCVFDVNQGSEHTEFDVEDLQFKGTPAGEFTLSAFGLPEIAEPKSAGHSYGLAPWLFGAALACLIVVIALRRRYAAR